jgi:hypothetical protein
MSDIDPTKLSVKQLQLLMYQEQQDLKKSFDDHKATANRRIRSLENWRIAVVAGGFTLAACVKAMWEAVKTLGPGVHHVGR